MQTTQYLTLFSVLGKALTSFVQRVFICNHSQQRYPRIALLPVVRWASLLLLVVAVASCDGGGSSSGDASGDGDPSDDGGSGGSGDPAQSDYKYTLDNDKITITDYTGTQKAITIPSSFTDTGKSYPVAFIGEWAFAGKNLASVTIPNSVTAIGEAAFAGNDLASVIIPNSVTSIGGGAFADNDLVSVTIPSSVTAIGDSAFVVNDLASITIPSSVTAIGDNVFGYNNLTSVTIPNSVTAIGGSAFAHNNLASVTIPSSVTSIGEWAFYNNKLASVIIPDSVTSIGDHAFQFNNLASVTILSSVTSIGDYAFQYNNLTSVIIPDSVTSIGERAFAYNDLTNVTIPDSVTSIGYGAFGGNDNLSSIRLPTPPANMTWIKGRSTVVNELTITDFSSSYYIGIQSDNYVFTVSDGNATITYHSGMETALTIPASFSVNGTTYPVTAIGSNTFSGNQNLQTTNSNPNLSSITLPEPTSDKRWRVRSTIGPLLPGLTTAKYNYSYHLSPNNAGDHTDDDYSYTLADSKITITFYWGSNTELTGENSIPASFAVNGSAYPVTAIGEEAFYNNDLTNDVTIPDSVTSIGDSAFAINNLTSVTIPGSVTSIGYGAFAHNNLTSVTIPGSVTSIGEEAFYDNKLASVTIPNSVTSIGEWAFNTNELTSVTIPSSVTFIDDGAFGDNDGLSSITLPKPTSNKRWRVRSKIGPLLPGLVITKFNDSYHLSSHNVHDVGDHTDDDYSYTLVDGKITITFYWGSNTELTGENSIPASFTVNGSAYPVTAIGNSAFSSNDLTSDVTIPDSVTSIGRWAFYNNHLISVTIPDSVTSIDNWAFGYNELTSVTFAPNSQLSFIGDSAFDRNGDLSSITLPEPPTGMSWRVGSPEGDIVTDLTIIDFGNSYYRR